MRKESLDSRSSEILNSLVRIYIAQGEPVGSETLLRRTRLGLSAATIRNIMARLEGEGYLKQPHPSAGRVPSDKGYRLFVDSLGSDPRIRRADEDRIRTKFGREFEGTPHPLECVSRLLAELSQSVGLVVAAHTTQNELQHIEFVRLSTHRILVVLVTKPGIVQNRLLFMRESFTQEELDRTAHYLMDNFPGKSLAAIRTNLERRLSEEKAQYDELLKNAILLCQQQELNGEEEAAEVYIDGASRIVSSVTFGEIEKLKELLEAFEEKSKLLRLINECLATRGVNVRVAIGSENSRSELSQCAVISAPYRVNGKVVGSLGIIGPKRMPYEHTIGLVDYMAKTVSRMLSVN